MKYIQSFYQYPVTFSSIGRTVPARSASGELRNLAEFTDEEIEKLEASEPLYRSLVNQKKYRVLNKMPDSYRPASAQINEARAEAEELRKRVAELEAAAGKKQPAPAKDQEAEKTAAGSTEASEGKEDLSKLDYKELQERARGILDNVNVKKSVLIEAIESAEK